MKKLISTVLSVIILLTLVPFAAVPAAAYTEGSIPGTTGTGTYSDPIVVNTFAELEAALTDMEIEYVLLKGDISEVLPPAQSYRAGVMLHSSQTLKHLIIEGSAQFVAPLNNGAVYDSLIFIPANCMLDVSGTGTLSFYANGTNAFNAVIRNEGTCKIQDVSLIGSNNGTTYGCAVVNRENGYLLVNSGTFTGISAQNGHGPYPGVRIDGGTATIMQGTFRSSIYPGVTVDVGTNALYVYHEAACLLYGGSFETGINCDGKSLSTILGSDLCLFHNDTIVDSSQTRYNDSLRVSSIPHITIAKQPSPVTAYVAEAATVSVAAPNATSFQWFFCDQDGQVFPWPIVHSCAEVTGDNTSSMEFIPDPGWIGGWPGNGVYVYCDISNGIDTVRSDMVPITVKEHSESAYVFPFTDVKPSDWFYSDVVYANKNGLINGKTPTLYQPADNMTIAEAIKLASCMHQLNKTGSVTLTNGSPNWYDSYVQYAKSNGISWNYSNYNAPVTREEYVHIFYSALPASGYKAINSVASIPDVLSGNPYYKEILTFYNAGILTGNDPKGTFLPKSNIKRSEVAAILTRMMDNSARKTFTLIP